MNLNNLTVRYGFVILKAYILLSISLTEKFYNCLKPSNFYRNLYFYYETCHFLSTETFQRLT